LPTASAVVAYLFFKDSRPKTAAVRVPCCFLPRTGRVLAIAMQHLPKRMKER
jgi:hypothetical protein